MSKNKITFSKINQKKNNIQTLGTLELDFADILTDGKMLDLKMYANYGRLIHELGLSLLGYSKDFKAQITNMSTIHSYKQHMKWFTEFLDEVLTNVEKSEIRLKDINTQLFNHYYEWCHNRESFHSSTRSKAYHGIRRLIEYQQSTDNSLVANEFNAISKSPQKFIQYDNAEIYEEKIIDELMATCRPEINRVLQRLKLGETYLSTGVDPTDRSIRLTKPWAKIENILWYVKNKVGGRVLRRHEFKKEGHHTLINVLCGTRPEYRWRKEEIYSYLYPSVFDLIPFLIMLSIKTGLNKDSISHLKRDCIDQTSKADKSFKLKFSKSKTHIECAKRTFSCIGRFSVYHLVKEVLRITETLIPNASEEHRNLLFVGVVNNSTKGTVKPLRGSYLTNMINFPKERGWLYSHNLSHISYDFDKIRETYATNRYKQKGNLGKVQKELGHKDAGTSELHYIDSKATQDIHEQTIADVQDNLVFGGTVTGDKSEDITCQYAVKSGHNDKRVKEQDVFFASCKDFYNRPGGKKDTPCDQPWSCFTCKNGVWTTAALPKVIAFYKFMEEQRLALPLSDWESKFFVPYTIIKNKILPKFKTETINWAEREALDMSLFIPNSIRMT